MQYLLMVYVNEAGWVKLTPAEQQQGVAAYNAYTEALKKAGVDIARRTVAKYRETMSIPSSVQRRREKRALAKTSAF